MTDMKDKSPDRFAGNQGWLPPEFDWRHYVQHEELMSEGSAQILDELGKLISERDAQTGQYKHGDFRNNLQKGYFKGKVLYGFLQHLRDVLTPEEIDMLWAEVEKCGPSGYLGPKSQR